MKTFTLAEANALIPEIAKLIDELIQARDQLANRGAKLSPLLEHAGGNGGSQAGSAYMLALQHFNARLGLLQDLGCELKDLDQGLVDFPSYRDGKLVYLCWKRDEDHIRFWHASDSGFAGRQPL